ncbi:MAG TPA: DinB family protein [Bacteroidota bacterium]|nr:DinB family protein [Bacteroidota bacterium]
MSEKDMFITTWEREFQTTLKILKALPMDKVDLKPAEKSKSAKDLAWTFVGEEGVIIDGVCKGKIDFMSMPPPPATFQEVINTYETTHKSNVDRVKALTETELNSPIPWMIAPKQMGQVRRADVLWTAVMDNVHHRGQFSVYLRIAGAKVPSIYGPTADEPWM